MHTELIEADTIDEAAKQILRELKEDAAGTASSSSRRNVIYFDGWDGLGASAVLREVGRRLTAAASAEEPEPAPAGRRRVPAAPVLEFAHIFHIDCSKWESRRAMQRIIAEQVQLPAPVMDMLDAQDEADDFQGLANGSRAEIQEVSEAISEHIAKLNGRFVVIFHNGSNEEIDLDSFGIPLSARYSRNKVLWSFQGRFRLYPRTKVDMALKDTSSSTTTDVVLSASAAAASKGDLSDILSHEAAEVASQINIGGIDWSAAATNCFLYTMRLCGIGSRLVDYDLENHGCNYWRCDGIIQIQQGGVGTDGDESLWLFSDALQREMRLDTDYQNPYLPSPVVKHFPERISYWSSPIYGFTLIPEYGRIPKGMFRQLDKLHVLKISECEFSFTSPPFLYCNNLRFLWLDHCKQGSSSTDEVADEEDLRRCFQRMWVLDVRYPSNSDFLPARMMDFMTQLRELNVVGDSYLRLDRLLDGRRLRNIRKLRVTESGIYCRIDRPTDLFCGMDKLELLEFSRNHANFMMDSLSVESSCSSLETVIIDGSFGLQRISLKGCAKLKNLFLSGSFPDLWSLNITGAAVKTLDLSAVTAPQFGSLNLIGCGKLCAILWPPAAAARRERYIGYLRIDTTQKVGTTAGDHQTGRSETAEFDWHISVRDTRLLGSLEPIKYYFDSYCAHVEISTVSSPAHPGIPAATAIATNKGGTENGRQQVEVNLQHQQLLKDNALNPGVSVTLKNTSMQQQDKEGDYNVWETMCACPPPPCVPSQGCYVHIEDQMGTTLQNASITVPGFICESAKILHVHDSLFITSTLASPLGSTTWNQLEWCRVERCPMLECVFISQKFGGGMEIGVDLFKKLRTLWASHLPNARYIWNWNAVFGFEHRAFTDLTLLHLDYCPRMTYVVSLHDAMRALESLETLEIMWCGDLSVVFHFYDIGKYYSHGHGGPWHFPKLKRIHLHELPKLQRICSIGSNIYAPNLDTIKIRGCWSFKRLPIIGDNKVVECDCEKELWDRMEWDSFVQPKHYKPLHSWYYKKTMLRASVLR